MQYNILGKIKCSLCAHNINIDITHPVFSAFFVFYFYFAGLVGPLFCSNGPHYGINSSMT